MIGTELAHYRITAKLGEGGMGEVWRATDSKLGRDVAIKVLPDSFSQDPERLARFEREAKVLASLNHPHIAAIYGLEEAGAGKALVLELVEGPTLGERLARDSSRSKRRSRSPARSPRRSRRRTKKGSSIATSSRQTSSSPPAAR